MSLRLTALALSLFASLPSWAGRVHVQRLASSPPSKAARTPADGSPANCKSGSCVFNYYGGHVIPNVKVYAVLWGSQVAGPTKTGIGPFYKAITNHDWMDWLAEYSTDINITAGSFAGGAGTNQLIGRGALAGVFTIAPSRTSSDLGDSDVTAELDEQITATHLPLPDANSLYMIYFPAGVSITNSDLTVSCVNFCAYHSTYTRAGSSVYYSVFPDFSAGGCHSGCGNGNDFQNLCKASSHELAESITDAEVGIGTTVDFPLAFYDEQNGEVGDMCNDPALNIADILGLDGQPYRVQQIYSATTGMCQTTRTAGDDFKVYFHPADGEPQASITAGAAAAVLTLTTAVTSGAPPALQLSVSGLPPGVQATFDNPSITPGTKATLRLSADAGTQNMKDVMLGITAVGGALTHTAGLLVQVTGGAVVNDFTIGIDPPSAALLAGGSARYTITTGVASGVAEAVALGVTGVPAGVNAAFDAPTVTAGATAHLTLTAGAGTVPLTAFSVRGTSASQARGHAANATIQVDGRPQVTLTSPADGATVGGLVSVSATALAGANATLQSLALSIDGGASVASGTSGAAYAWDTTALANGSTHTISAVATDTDSGSKNATATVTISNVPAVVMTAPSDRSVVSGAAVSLAATASTPAGTTLTSLTLNVDGAPVASAAASPLGFAWDSTKVADGNHKITATAVASDGTQATSAAVTVAVQNGVGVVIGAPSEAATVAGTIQISATAVAPVGEHVTSFKLHLDGAATQLGPTGTAANLTYGWATTTVPNGAHSLTADVVFSGGGTATSAATDVVVTNPPTGVAIVTPSASIVSGTVAIVAQATTPLGTTLAGVTFFDGEAQLSTGASLSYSWDTHLVANGDHALSVQVIDADGGTTFSSPVVVTVKNDFTIALGTALTVLTIGADPKVVVVNTGSLNSAEPISLSVSGLPAGVTATLSPATVQAGASATLTLAAPASIPAAGATSFTVKGTTISVGAPGHSATGRVAVITPPLITLTAPAAGVVSGVVNVRATARVDPGATVARIDFFDGTTSIGSAAHSPASLQWSTAAVANGAHSLTARVTDSAGNQVTSSAVAVDVENVAAGTDFGLALTGDATLTAGGSAVLTVSTTAVGAAQTISLLASGMPSDVTASFDPNPVAAGSPSTLTLSARSAASATSSTLVITGVAGAIRHSVQTALTALVLPTVALTAPAAGTHVTGTVQLAAVATASAGTTLARVEFRADDTAVGTDTATPAHATWETSTLKAGNHVLTARVVDGAGNAVTSAPVTVVVDAATVTPPPNNGKGGGCSSAGGSGWIFSLFGLLAAARRRRS